MTTRAQNIKLAIFLGVTFLVLGGLLLMIAGRGFWTDTDVYYVRTQGSVQGLERGSTVSVRGVEVGEVESFHLFPEGYGGVEVVIAIDADVPVPEGAQAELKFQGLTGLKMIDLTGGDLDAGVIEPGSTLVLKDGTIDVLAARAAELMDRSEELIENLVGLTGAETQRRLDRLLYRADAALASAEEAAQSVRLAGQKATSGATAALMRIGLAATEAQRAFSQTRETVSGARQLLSGVGQTVAQLRRLVRSSREPIQETVSNLKRASESLEEFGRELRYQPSRLFFGRPPKERELP